jgi:hypothetical protein
VGSFFDGRDIGYSSVIQLADQYASRRPGGGLFSRFHLERGRQFTEIVRMAH